MSNVRIPIKTIRKGNKITKVCVEDFYKMINRIARAEQRSAEIWNEIWDSLDKTMTDSEGDPVTGCFIIGKGVSQPNAKDAFDEEIGNNIAFMKAKLNANLKKRNILFKLYNAANITLDAIDDEIDKIDGLINMDLVNLRKYNPDYLNYLDEYGYLNENKDEVQEED